ncbi:MAG: hypothetical protein L3J39_17790 [Verrucomicrobiales bacterium]|nr:hypothetical protein [Verrucomicrobiales bacterium]
MNSNPTPTLPASPLRIAAVQMHFASTIDHNEEIITATLDMNLASGKYALDSLQHPEFLRQHWRSIIADSKEQAQSESSKLLNAIF